MMSRETESSGRSGKCGGPTCKKWGIRTINDQRVVISGGMNTEMTIEPNPAVKQGVERVRKDVLSE